ncbi:hypothetical protein [Coralloluteibacterium stylophorae]|uniref:Type II secretion system protein GspE N-terminal domain-containing protein n=1 Tax=Coralloluteibacterium stylophorae TaxID=1776034 RepID=A0A8J7VU23_9GAMM|nr:hypothetical protein [Coralloluteibacterium stylophorae]MBS7457834.1 hypothetical protein [Coralloluteibacterium stylophorae]
MATPLPAPEPTPRLGDLLLGRGLVREADLERALELQPRVGGRIGSLLIRIGALSENQLLDALAEQLELPLLGREVNLPVDPGEWGLPDVEGLDPDWMLDQQAIPWREDEAVWCAARDPRP